MGSIICVLGNWAKCGGIKRRAYNSRLGLQLTTWQNSDAIHLSLLLSSYHHLIIIIIITPSTFALIPTLIGILILAHGISRGEVSERKRSCLQNWEADLM